MEKIAIGSSGLQTSRIGLGTWPIGGWMWAITDEVQAVMRHSDYDFFLSLVTRAARLGSSLTLKVAFLQLRTQTAESGLERLMSRLAVTG
jgi:hypothetical protein